MSRSPAFAALVFAYHLVVPACPAGGLPKGSPLPLPFGEWIVRTPLVLADVELTLRGSLIVERGGMLDLRGVRLRLDSASDGQLGIEVRDGGALFARPSPVTGAATTFAGGDGPGRYWFHVHPHAGLLLDRAEVRDAGWSADEPGLVVERDPSSAPGDVIVIDSAFHDDHVGLTLIGSTDAVLTSRFYANRSGGLTLRQSAATLALLQVSGQPAGILLEAGSDATLTGLTVESNDVALSVRDSSPDVGHSVFVANGEHGRFAGSGTPRVHDDVLALASRTAVTVAGGVTPIFEHDDFVRNGVGLAAESGRNAPIAAENNWWGAEDGPSGAGPGGGDSVSDGVDFTPWCETSCIRAEGQ